MKKAVNRKFLTVFNGEPTPAATPTEPAPSQGEPSQGEPSTFSKEQVEKIVQERLAKHKTTNEQTIKELQAIKAKANITEQERSSLQKRISELEEASMSKEEIARRQFEKLETEKKEREQKLSEEAKLWKDRYTNSTIKSSIYGAASAEKAYNNEQIFAILAPHAQLVEETDKTGAATGNLVTKIALPDRDSEGNPIKLDLTVEQAVKQLKEKDSFKNLFVDTTVPGLGTSNSKTGGVKKDAASYAKMGPAEYQKARKSGVTL